MTYPRIMLNKRFNPYYLFFLSIPLVFFILRAGDSTQKNLPEIDFLYFSARATRTTGIQLFSGKEQLASWTTDSLFYKYFDYAGDLSNGKYLYLKILNLGSNDTLRILSFNLLRKNSVSTLFRFINPDEYITNARVIADDDCIALVPISPEAPVKISLQPADHWNRESPEGNFTLFLEIVFLLVFVFINIMQPPARYFIFSCVLTLLTLLLLSLCNGTDESTLTLSTSNQLGRTEVYYNHYPEFTKLKYTYLENQEQVFQTRVNLSADRFFRFDFDQFNKLEGAAITIRNGLFRKTWLLSKIPPGALCINDMAFKDGVFYAVGSDAFMSLSTQTFINGIRRLIWLRQCTYLFFALMAFVVLIALHRLLAPRLKLMFRPFYLAFLLLPLIYVFLDYTHTAEKDSERAPDYFYFSAAVSKPVTISLFADNDSITSWDIRKPGFQMRDCLCPLKDSGGITLRIDSMAANDSLALLSFHLYRGHTLYSLSDRVSPYLTAENASPHLNGGIYILVANSSYAPVKLHLAGSAAWEKTSLNAHPPARVKWLIFSFILAFIFLLITTPSLKAFLTALSISLGVLLLFYWLTPDIFGKIVIETSTPQRYAEIFNSPDAIFKKDNSTFIKGNPYLKNAEIAFNKKPFIRCDLDDSLKLVTEYNLAIKNGLFRKTWNLAQTPPEYLVANDLFIYNGLCYITGNDPFFGLGSVFFVKQAHLLADWRLHAYIFIALFVFVCLISGARIIERFKLHQSILVLLFAVMAFSQLLFWPFHSDRLKLPSENRNASPLPAFNIDSSTAYSKALNNYLNDQVPGRSRLISVNNYIYYSLFRQLLNNPFVYFGKDGWMFYIGEGYRDFFENKTPLTDTELHEIVSLFEIIRDAVEARGAKLYIVIPRLPHYVYEDKLGKRLFQHRKPSKYEQFTAYAKEHATLPLIDVNPVIREARRKTGLDMYYKTDSHWNYVGAYLAYNKLMQTIHRDFPETGAPIPFNEIQWDYTRDSIADLADMSGMQGYILKGGYVPRHPLLRANTDTLPPPAFYPFKHALTLNPKKEGPNMLLFHDSYARLWYPYLGCHFRHSTFLWTFIYDNSYLDQFKPDVVIWEMSERSLQHFIYENRGLK
ncbi:MAG: hypothetical protein BWY70_00478 [Bacteroidetes bacterium ADurb.Bin408]|nr:MAG: hypothetical protein BWY70_00478 [Bacteroidetes bacterium ADurb.Bin408]